MTEIGYFQIEEAIANLLRTDARTATINDKEITVVVEETFAPMANTPWAGVYLKSWETPAEEERIGAGTHFVTFLNIEIWLYEYSLEHREGAILRDEFLRKVKEVFKDPKNRSLDGNALMTTFAGGEFDNATDKGNKGFYKGVSMILTVEVRE